MPEGVSSIADLQVIVTARTAEASEGIAQIRGVIEQFAGAGGASLGRIDAGLLAVGNRVQWLRATFGVWMQAAEAFMGLLGSSMNQVQGLADQAGQGDRFTAFRTQVEGVARTLDGLLGDAIGGVRNSLGFLDEAQMRAAASGSTFGAVIATAADHATRAVGELNAMIETFRAIENVSTASLERMLRAARTEAQRLHVVGESLTGTYGRINQDLTQFTDLSTIADQHQRDRIMMLETELFMRRLIAGIQTQEAAAEDANFEQIYFNLNRQVVALDQKARTLGMSAAAAAELLAYERALDAYRDRTGNPDATFTPEQEERVQRMRELMRQLQGQIDAHADAQKRAREEERRNRQFEKDIAGAEREIRTLEAKSRALYMSAGAAAEMTMRERLLAQVSQQGITLTEERRARIEDVARAFGEATAASQRFADAMKMVQETGSVVSRGLESAFRKWTEGTKLDVREMVSSIIRDLAVLTMRQAVLNPLQNMAQQGIGSLLAGFRADGGPVSAASAYVVGERGPELFVPDVAGQVIPSERLLAPAAAPSVTVSLAVDARGATVDAVPMISARIAELEARLPRTILATVADARERGLM